jgi:hypothetical protein
MTVSVFSNQLGKILLFVTSYEKCNVSQRQLILKSVTLYVKIRKNFYYLQSCLTGEAKHVIEALSISSDNSRAVPTNGTEQLVLI